MAKKFECDYDCDVCDRGEYNYGINGFGEVEEVLLHPCGSTSEI